MFSLGGGDLRFGQQPYPKYGTPPSADATFYEKEKWETYHGSIPQCGYFAQQQGPLVLLPSTGSFISKVSTRYVLAPGDSPYDIKDITYTLSTRYAIKTVRYDDQSVNLSWVVGNNTATTIQKNPRDDLLEWKDSVSVELDTEKMGFGPSAFGPNQQFVLVITPKDECYRALEIWGWTPVLFSPGTPIEIPRWL
ncbi:MAG: hypothetical protein M0Q92_05080 [Methanoregula sp.]|jgi:hypothetical protein|nr:hypothetical protein [Methanoregula sp.]